MDEKPAKPANKKAFIKGLLDYLQSRREDRGVMADLRHGLSPTTEYRAWPHIAMWCDLGKNRSRRIMLTVSAAFAIHGRSVPGSNLGSVLRDIATGDGRGEKGLATFDARFRRFLSCSTAEEVCDHLPGVIRAAERKGVALDLARLYADLTYWGERIKVNWARSYWGAGGTAPVSNQQVSS